MSCCGKKRNEYAGKLSTGQAAHHPVITNSWEDVLFEYTGNAALTVKGIVTGKLYRFVAKGSLQLVDYRDASGMMAVSNLERKRSS